MSIWGHPTSLQALLQQSVHENKTDVALLSDPYRIPAKHSSWVADKSGIVTIVSSPDDEGFVIAKVNREDYANRQSQTGALVVEHDSWSSQNLS